MKAFAFQKVGEPLSLQEIPEPEAHGSDLVVQVKSCGICGSDLHAASLPPGLPTGTVMGHEFAGEVVEVGPESRAIWKPGDRVCSLPYIGCARCRACLSGDGTQCPSILATGLGGIPGAYAERVRVGSIETLRLPESVSWSDGALVEPLSVALHAVEKSMLANGENVLVLGAGPIGLATAMWARFFGARRVVVSEKAPGRLEMAARFGATDAIDASKEVVGAAFHKLTGAAPDVIFECVGAPGMIQQAIMMAPARGRIVVVGVCMQPDTLLPVTAILKEVSLHFVIAYRKQDFQMTLDMLDQERIGGREMITDVVGIEDFPSAFEALKQPTHQCKVVLTP